jgi:hypothetical protein
VGRCIIEDTVPQNMERHFYIQYMPLTWVKGIWVKGYRVKGYGLEK